MNEAVIIFPHQLFAHHPGMQNAKLVILIEIPLFFTKHPFHKWKLILHRASMKFFEDDIDKRTYNVLYIPFANADKKNIIALLKKNAISHLHVCEVVDHTLRTLLNEIKKVCKLHLIEYETPAFLTPMKWANEYFNGKNRYFMAPFYRAQRKRLSILIKNKKPIGGSWSFDQENRKPFDPKIKIPSINTPKKNKYVQEAITYVEKHFKKNPGKTEGFFYPVTRSSSKAWLKDFLKNRLTLFGDYEDAFAPDEPFLFHSVLSALLNIGLLTPDEVIRETLSYAKKNNVPINSLEGFIRQLIGWREFVRIVYEREGKKQKRANFFRHRKKLPHTFWTATTGILPIDATIRRILDHAYTHHIERLMVLGNFMLLNQIHPDEVYQWFTELFIDAYDWVMIPNVYGMSQYADGGIMTTKPYISSSQYILKMSSYKKEQWCDIWDGLYWRFVKKHEKKLSKNPRLNLTLFQLKKMDKKELKEKITTADSFLRTFHRRK